MPITDTAWRSRKTGQVVAVFEKRQPGTAAKFINKSSLFIQLLGVIRRLELKPNSEQKVENIPACRQAGSSPRHIAKPPVVRRFNRSD